MNGVDVVLTVDGVELPVQNVTFEEARDLSAETELQAGGWDGAQITLTMTGYLGPMVRPPRPYQPLRWRRLLPGSRDAVGRQSIRARRGIGRAFVGWWLCASKPWVARVSWGVSYDAAEFSRRCDAKRWCERRLEEMSR